MGRGGGRSGGSNRDKIRLADSYREPKSDTPAAGPAPTAFKSKDKDDGSGKTNTYFNTPDQGGVHGDVAQSQRSDGQTQYHYARDNEGRVYIDDNPNSSTYTGHQTERPEQK